MRGSAKDRILIELEILFASINNSFLHSFLLVLRQFEQQQQQQRTIHARTGVGSWHRSSSAWSPRPGQPGQTAFLGSVALHWGAGRTAGSG